MALGSIFISFSLSVCDVNLKYIYLLNICTVFKIMVHSALYSNISFFDVQNSRPKQLN
jgi:hypothetical protein